MATGMRLLLILAAVALLGNRSIPLASASSAPEPIWFDPDSA